MALSYEPTETQKKFAGGHVSVTALPDANPRAEEVLDRASFFFTPEFKAAIDEVRKGYLGITDKYPNSWGQLAANGNIDSGAMTLAVAFEEGFGTAIGGSAGPMMNHCFLIVDAETGEAPLSRARIDEVAEDRIEGIRLDDFFMYFKEAVSEGRIKEEDIGENEPRSLEEFEARDYWIIDTTVRQLFLGADLSEEDEEGWWPGTAGIGLIAPDDPMQEKYQMKGLMLL